MVNEEDEKLSLAVLATKPSLSAHRRIGSTLQPKAEVPKQIKERLSQRAHRFLEKAATEYMLLWQTVNEENPAIDKIYDRIKDSHRSIEKSLQHWKKNLKYFKFMPNVQELYGRFLKDVLHQNQEGTELIYGALERIKKESRQRLLPKNISYLTDFSNFPVPCLVLKKSISVRKKEPHSHQWKSLKLKFLKIERKANF